MSSWRLAAVALCAAATGSDAHFYSGNENYADCVSNDVTEKTLCSQYLAGVYDGLQASDRRQEALGKPRTSGLCVPEGVTLGQVRDIVLQFSLQHPELRHGSAAVIAHIALLQAFAC